MMTPFFSGQNISCIRSGNNVFSSKDFSLNKGELLFVTGPNGSGKSSFLQILSGLSTSNQGHLHWNGLKIKTPSQNHFQRLHYLGHDRALKDDLTPFETLCFWSNMPASMISDTLELFGLNNHKYRPIKCLSHGQKQRLTLARLHLSEKPLWILDEPTTGLDEPSFHTFVNALNIHLQKGGLAVIATHAPFQVPFPTQVISMTGTIGKTL
ncbi:MAG: heme ABC exporter ATP-binding protein CcmA [Alphaproteobacteria bacterium]|jgi:heme exporter protein A|nr:heme ABC exporter ATP-binding protein CcmA [Alphaproteobacteria bacterium]